MITEDATLIEECLAGRPDAFGELVVRYQDRLYHTLVHVLGSSEDARDVAQEAFTHAFLHLKSFGGRSAFYSWLFRIALNAAVTLKRKTKRTSSSIEAIREQTGGEPVDGRLDQAPSHSLELLERRQMVRTALGTLTEEFRTPLVLKEMDGMKYEEIAEILGCPIGTVRSRIHRARLELRQRLETLLREND